MSTTNLVGHIGHLLAVNASGTSGTAPSGQLGVRIDFVVLHCQQCNVDVLTLPASETECSCGALLGQSHSSGCDRVYGTLPNQDAPIFDMRGRAWSDPRGTRPAPHTYDGRPCYACGGIH